MSDLSGPFAELEAWRRAEGGTRRVKIEGYLPYRDDVWTVELSENHPIGPHLASGASDDLAEAVRLALRDWETAFGKDW